MAKDAFLRFTGGPALEWHDVNYLRQTRPHRRKLTALGLVCVIALLDLYGHSNFSILYIAPIILLARDVKPLAAWPMAGATLAFVYGIFIVKNIINPPEGEWSYFDARLLNRTITAAMILAISQLLNQWLRWRAELADGEWPENLRDQDREISESFAVLFSVPVIALIVVLDFFLPAQFNLPILYPIPLLICGWTRSRRLVWAMLAVLACLAVTGFVWGPPATVSNFSLELEGNRLLAMVAMVLIALTLDHWMRRGIFDSG